MQSLTSRYSEGERNDGRPDRARRVRFTGLARRCSGRRRCCTQGRGPGFRPAPFRQPPRPNMRVLGSSMCAIEQRHTIARINDKSTAIYYLNKHDCPIFGHPHRGTSPRLRPYPTFVPTHRGSTADAREVRVCADRGAKPTARCPTSPRRGPLSPRPSYPRTLLGPPFRRHRPPSRFAPAQASSLSGAGLFPIPDPRSPIPDPRPGRPDHSQPQRALAFCCFCHAVKGVKYSSRAEASICFSPVRAARASGQGLLAPMASIACRRVPASLLP
jgi:hypothetical protein